MQSRLFLEPGDLVDIVAPSSKCHPGVLEHMRHLIESWGLKCHIPEDLFGDNFLYANSDENRLKHLQYAFLNPYSKAVWCLIGGFGATKLIPGLSKMPPPPFPKKFIGFSDITALHLFLNKQWRWSTIHGPSGYQASLGKISVDSLEILKNILLNRDYSLSYDRITPLNRYAENENRMDATIIGGNLHLIQASIGTSWHIDTVDKILFIEETNERAYRVDRVLEHFKQVGIFDRVKAVFFGDFIDKGEPDGRFLLQKTLEEFAKTCKFPVLQIRGIGHGQINNPLLFGVKTCLQTGDGYSLVFDKNASMEEMQLLPSMH
jgi:muramoyltetrapeptide carboxypeptidase